MSSITYPDLRELYITRAQREDEWRTGLINTAYALSIKVAQKLEAPELWTDRISGRQHRYIEVISLTNGERPQTPPELLEDMIATGEVPFGVSITLDRDTDAFPKTTMHVAVAVKYSQKSTQLCFWDDDQDQPFAGSNWSADTDAFADEVISTLKEVLEHDPRDGLKQRKMKIGFIQE